MTVKHAWRMLLVVVVSSVLTSSVWIARAQRNQDTPFRPYRARPLTEPLYWEMIASDSKAGNAILRTAVPGGWLVHLDEKSSLVYVPDKFHAWLDEQEEDD